MSARRTLGAALAVLLAAATAACGSSPSSSLADYTLGVLVSQTGSAGQLGVGEMRGAQLAADDINAAGGVDGHHLRLVIADDQSTTQQSVQQARSLLQQHVLALVGPSVVGDCNAVIPIVAAAGPLDYCLSPGITPSNKWVWSASVATADFAHALVTYWKQRGITRLGLISTTDGSGVQGAQAVAQAVASVPGTSLVARQSYPPTAVDVTTQLQQVASAAPQAIVVWATGTPSGVALKGIQQLGLSLPVATTNGNLANAFLQRIRDYQPATLLVPATSDIWWQHLDAHSPQYALEQRYHAEFQQRFGENPDFGPGVGYDAVSLVARALHSSGADPVKLRAALEQLTSVAGVVGVYSFSPANHRGLAVDDVAITRVTSGSFVFDGP